MIPLCQRVGRRVPSPPRPPRNRHTPPCRASAFAQALRPDRPPLPPSPSLLRAGKKERRLHGSETPSIKPEQFSCPQITRIKDLKDYPVSAVTERCRQTGRRDLPDLLGNSRPFASFAGGLLHGSGSRGAVPSWRDRGGLARYSASRDNRFRYEGGVWDATAVSATTCLSRPDTNQPSAGAARKCRASRASPTPCSPLPSRC